MELESAVLLAVLIFAAAALYSSVGHAGASGYLAAMALFGMAPLEMKPAALTLNILVAAIATVKYVKAGRFSWPVFWPFALSSIPFAYLGGLILLPGAYYKPIVGLVLVFAAFRFVMDAAKPDYMIKPPPMPAVLASGAALGFLSGLVGVGGGIFLSPLLIMLRWEAVKKVSGVAAAFILVNSIAGLLGFLSSNTPQLPPGIALWAVAAVLGGYLGAEYGSKRLGSPAIKRLLSLVLLVAGVKMIATF
jgi:uncharacterized membrane protein YfcA